MTRTHFLTNPRGQSAPGSLGDVRIRGSCKQSFVHDPVSGNLTAGIRRLAGLRREAGDLRYREADAVKVAAPGNTFDGARIP